MMLDEILSKFKIKPTSSNMVFKRGQHVASNNIASDNVGDVGPTCWLCLNKPLNSEKIPISFCATYGADTVH